MFEKCEYLISAVRKEQFPNKNKRSEFVFVGRSNIGKSSLINAITKRKLLARTSSRPGKTIAINFYNIDDSFYLVDVPGYGYANHSKEQIAKFGEYIEEYLVNNQNVKIVFLLVDTKIGPTKDDIIMFNFLQYLHLNIVVVSTKLDKLGTTMRTRAYNNIKKKLGINDILPTSSSKRIGIDQVISRMKQYI